MSRHDVHSQALQHLCDEALCDGPVHLGILGNQLVVELGDSSTVCMQQSQPTDTRQHPTVCVERACVGVRVLPMLCFAGVPAALGGCVATGGCVAA